MLTEYYTYMSRKSSGSLTSHNGHHPLNSSSSTASSLTAPATHAKPVPEAGKSFAVQSPVTVPVKDYSYASLGAITEGHYTEF
jgi:hypothetical protein